MAAALSAAGFAEATGVSRETLDRFEAYLDLLTRWQAKINLVGAATLADPWRRHFLDSAQLLPLVDAVMDAPLSRAVDIGSGAGFPGLVLAILGIGPMTLVESDQRKAAFLREAARVTGAPVTVFADRAERLAGPPAALVTARACASVANLIDLAHGFTGPGTRFLLLKGREVDKELTDSALDRMIRLERFPSRTDPAAQILRFNVGGAA